MKKTRILVGLVILVLTLSGCAAKAEMPVSQESADYRNSVDGGVLAPAAAPMAEEFAGDSTKGTGVAGAETEFVQMVIMNAELSIAVDDPTVSMADIQKMAKDMGGFTVSSYLFKTQTSNGIEVPEANLTVRVPAERLDEALVKIKAMTGDPKKYTLYENVSGQDVTQEYTDLQSRLRNLEEADAKLSEFYENATKTEDALAIYQQKMQVTEQIEILKGQIQYYEQAAAKSAITVRIQSKETIAPITVAGWQPSGVVRDAIQALVNFGKGLVDFLIWLVILIVPIIVVIGLPIFFLVRWLKRRSRKARAARVQSAYPQAGAETPAGGKPPLPPR